MAKGIGQIAKGSLTAVAIAAALMLFAGCGKGAGADNVPATLVLTPESTALPTSTR